MQGLVVPAHVDPVLRAVFQQPHRKLFCGFVWNGQRTCPARRAGHARGNR